MLEFLAKIFNFEKTDYPIGVSQVSRYNNTSKQIVTKYKGKECVIVRAPVRTMIDFCYKQITILRRYPHGVDTLSVTGYTVVAKNLERFEQIIDEGPCEPNIIWNIVGEYAPFFTVFQYMMLIELADQVVGTPPEKRYQPLSHLNKKKVV